MLLSFFIFYETLSRLYRQAVCIHNTPDLPFLYFMKLCRGYTAKPYVYTTRPICSFEADELRIKSVCRTCHMTLTI